MCEADDGNYEKLVEVFELAFERASKGKGKERHASGEPYEDQPICAFPRVLGDKYDLGGGLYQIMKKAREIPRIRDKKGDQAALLELLDIINYAAANVILLQEKIQAYEISKTKYSGQRVHVAAGRSVVFDSDATKTISPKWFGAVGEEPKFDDCVDRSVAEELAKEYRSPHRGATCWPAI
jgi:hypothetical protein